MKLEICIHCVMYQHRLDWMLSSILRQKGEPPDILVSISHIPDNGNPTTEKLCDFFREQGLNIKQTILKPEQAPNRAIGRNIQVKETEADWMLFSDSDMVYHPMFFNDIKKKCEGKFAKETRVIGADRISLDIPFCIKYFEEDKREYPCVIEDPAKICAEWPVKWVTGRKTCPGNFQLARVEAIKEKGGIYSGRQRDYYRRTKSDRAFRCHMGGRTGMRVLPQYHLNHDRGGPEIQR